MPWTLKCLPILSKIIEKVSCRIQTFLTLYLSALLFVIAVSTNEWFLCGTKVKTGIWSICLFQPTSNHWKCDSFKSDFAVAVQAFSMMCIFGYVLTVVFLVIFIKCPTSTSTMFSLTLSLCLLCLSIEFIYVMVLWFSTDLCCHDNCISRSSLQRDKKNNQWRHRWCEPPPVSQMGSEPQHVNTMLF
ncbi:unnamed protein product [Mytilus coruscus]|uniref:Uncharacterized protein n=1 Tax=Mytilus coruscus TaxID=42192 RepID=A0A6J8D991_MYTCO|nr:unnamed protein product [Mytilus coruscus]